MADQGDDCYFYYYSKCNKGVNCPFRHVEAALGNETTCTLWRSGHCFRPNCMYRHMEITVDRRNIPCYWENQPTGCMKTNCMFKHFKDRPEVETVSPDPPRKIVHTNTGLDAQGAGVQTDTTQIPDSCPAMLQAAAPNSKLLLSDTRMSRNTSSPQMELDNRPSPKIEPIVVNPFSDDSDHEIEPIVKIQPRLQQKASDTDVNVKPQKEAALRKRRINVQDSDHEIEPRVKIQPRLLQKASDTDVNVKLQKEAALRKRRINVQESTDDEKKKSTGQVRRGVTRRNVIIDAGKPNEPDPGKMMDTKRPNRIELNVPTLSLSDNMKRRLGSKSKSEVEEDRSLEKKKANPVKNRLGTHPMNVSSNKHIKSRLGYKDSDYEEPFIPENTFRPRTSVAEFEDDPKKDSTIQSRWEAAIANKSKKSSEIKQSPIVSSDSSEYSEDEIDSIVVKSLEEIREEKAKRARIAVTPVVETKPRPSSRKPVLAGFIGLKTLALLKQKAAKQEHSQCTNSEDENVDLVKKSNNGETKQSSVDEFTGSVSPVTRQESTQVPRPLKKERQIYMPPALKTSGKTILVREKKIDSPENVVRRKVACQENKPAEKTEPTKSVEIKSFAQIMEEKRKKRLELMAATNGNQMKQKSTIRPIVFDLDKTDSTSSKSQVSAVATRISHESVKNKIQASVAPLQPILQNTPTSVQVSPLRSHSTDSSASIADTNTNIAAESRAVKAQSIAILTPSSSHDRLSASRSSFDATENPSSLSTTKRPSPIVDSASSTAKTKRLSLLEDDDLLNFHEFSFEDGLECDKIDDAELMNDIDKLLS